MSFIFVPNMNGQNLTTWELPTTHLSPEVLVCDYAAASSLLAAGYQNGAGEEASVCNDSPVTRLSNTRQELHDQRRVRFVDAGHNKIDSLAMRVAVSPYKDNAFTRLAKYFFLRKRPAGRHQQSRCDDHHPYHSIIPPVATSHFDAPKTCVKKKATASPTTLTIIDGTRLTQERARAARGTDAPALAALAVLTLFFIAAGLVAIAMGA